MLVYALIIEAHSDDDRLIGVYSSVEAAKEAYRLYPDSGYFPFYRIEARELDGSAFEYDQKAVVYEHYSEDD